MNFRRILSKSSLKSSSSSEKSQPEEVTKLQSEIELLKQTIDSLKVSIESRDAAIGTLAREKEKIYVELKSAQRTNRNLHQQLVDERDIHSKEKDFLINEIKRLTKRNENETNAQDNRDQFEDQVKSAISDELKARDEVICNIGAKYLKIKTSKTLFQKKFEKLQAQNKKTCENIILLLQDNRKTLDSLLDKLLKSSSISPNSRKYLKLLQINASLHYENTQLKIYLSSHQDRTSNVTQEPSNKYCSIGKQTTSGTKSEEKMNHLSINSMMKLLNAHEFESLKSFKYIHKTFSPNIRGTIYRSVSDSCIVRSTISELC
ncbi:unnamed protein product [Spodoptera littoralis]|uniref:Uncharacterized protein n=1 Tax=Spodoptera littoralis TaxID=7109 RepID=A0A9P0N4X5_SPOLI|nr:unnamed protein product [Spodoptera littoralis]CAH1641669.1 unnamed protein product [Spodoptera littoralis]